MSHHFRPSRHLGEINTLGLCHPSCLLFHPSLGFLPFFLAKIKPVLNWDSVSRTCRASQIWQCCLPLGVGGGCGAGHHLQIEMMQMRVQIFAWTLRTLPRTSLHQPCHTHSLFLVQIPFRQTDALGVQPKTEPHSFFRRAEEVLFFDLINDFFGPWLICVSGLH